MLLLLLFLQGLYRFAWTGDFTTGAAEFLCALGEQQQKKQPTGLCLSQLAANSLIVVPARACLSHCADLTLGWLQASFLASNTPTAVLWA